jgi:hypothetical protein
MLTLANLGTDKNMNKLDRRYELLDEVYIISDFLKPDGRSARMEDSRLVFQVWKRTESLRSTIVRKQWIWRSPDFMNSEFWYKCVTATAPIYLSLDEFIHDTAQYTCRKPRGRNEPSPFYHASVTVNGDERWLSENLLGFGKLPEVSMTDIETVMKGRHWRSWKGGYIYPDTLNQLLDEFYSGKTFKTKQF